MKKSFLLVIFIFILSSCGNEEIEQKVDKYYKTEITSSSKLLDSESFVGYVKSDLEVMLSAEWNGKLILANKDIWDFVSASETLAKIDTNEISQNIKTANEITNSLEVLKSNLSSSYDSGKKVLESKIAWINANLKWSQVWLWDIESSKKSQIEITKSNIKVAESSLETAKTNLEQTKNVLSQTEENLFKNANSAITNSVILDTNILKYIDVLFWITKENEDKNDSFEYYLWAKSSWSMDLTKSLFNKINSSFLQYKKDYEEKIETKKANKEEILKMLETGNSIALDLKILLKNAYGSLDNSIESNSLTRENINSYMSQISNFWKDVESSILSVSWNYILWLNWSYQSINDFYKEKDKNLALLEKAVSLASEWVSSSKSYLSQIESSSNSEKNKVETSLNVWKTQIDEIKSQIQSLEKEKQAKLKEVDLQISQSKWNKSSAQILVSNSNVISPFSWIILEKLSEEWQIVWFGQAIYKIAPNSNLKIKVLVSDEILRTIKIGQEVLLEKNIISKWKISLISPQKDEFSKKTMLEITFDNSKLRLVLWDSVDVSFSKRTISWVKVPNSAILSNFLKPAVMVKKENKALFKEIKILKQTDTFSIVSGINVWEEIIIEWKENIFDGESLK